LKSDTTLQVLARSYGRQVVGAPGAPGSWGEGGPYHEIFRGYYRVWSNRARQNNYPELFYLFEAIIWNLEGRSAADIEEILRDIDGLSDKDGENYEKLLIQLANQDFVRKPSEFSGRIAKRALDFIAAHADNSTRVAKVAEKILPLLARSYGLQVVGAAGAPGSWGEGEADHEIFRNYRAWSDRARQNNYPELFYLFEAIIWNLEGRSAADIEEILRDIDDLNEVDGESYENLLIELANQEFVLERSEFSGRIAERVRDFIAAHADNSTRVAKVAEKIRQ